MAQAHLAVSMAPESVVGVLKLVSPHKYPYHCNAQPAAAHTAHRLASALLVWMLVVEGIVVFWEVVQVGEVLLHPGLTFQAGR